VIPWLLITLTSGPAINIPDMLTMTATVQPSAEMSGQVLSSAEMSGQVVPSASMEVRIISS
jgi:hypothetical protein